VTSKRRKGRAGRATATGLGDALEFMRALWELDHALRRVSKSMQSTLGVTGPQRLVIRMLGHFPGLTAGELAALLHVDPSSLTGVLDRMRRTGILAREADPEDGRRAVLALTRRGRALDRTRSGTVEAAIVRAVASQPRARIAGARRVLEALVRELNATLSSGAARR
jgi:DNA-binding MarR family transcriptional regulator